MIDQICLGAKSAEFLNALHACRDGHPLNGPYQWRNAHAIAVQRATREVDSVALDWLRRKADIEGKLK